MERYGHILYEYILLFDNHLPHILPSSSSSPFYPSSSSLSLSPSLSSIILSPSFHSHTWPLVCTLSHTCPSPRMPRHPMTTHTTHTQGRTQNQSDAQREEKEKKKEKMRRLSRHDGLPRHTPSIQQEPSQATVTPDQSIEGVNVG